jgi:prepilin-type processing-associated H-X9-DG protein/prepilin-type N-terminal cleavage/methylation domain-containing protein
VRHPVAPHNGAAESRTSRKSPPERAFTLVELLAVIALVGVLAALLVPALEQGREAARAAACATNLRQLAAAALSYAADHGGEFPWGMRTEGGETACWDFTTGAGGKARPGVIWERIPECANGRVLQCPSYVGGNANWRGDPYTGYNYNCSYVGKVEGDPALREAPVRLAALRDPARTALFGDGEYIGGANKFMRAPKVDRQNDFSGKGLREAGTQGFRHGGRTNAVFADGHVESLRQSYRFGGEPGFVGGRSGFLSPDNSLYGGD